MDDPLWSREALSLLRLGVFCEYYAKMEFTYYGLQIFSSDVDDHGVDFVAKTANRFIKVQVKGIRLATTKYIFVRKKVFDIFDPDLYLYAMLLTDGEQPDTYLIPATAWQETRTDKLFVFHRDYKFPEYGLNISKKGIEALAKYKAKEMLPALGTRSDTDAETEDGRKKGDAFEDLSGR